MKTNNRLSKDNNTHEPKVRPMVKEKQLEFICSSTKHRNGGFFWIKEGETAICPMCCCATAHFPRQVREVERPMNNTEYIEYLEKENQELKEKLETKTHFLTLEEKRVSNLMKLVNEQQDKILKVVEEIVLEHSPIPMRYCEIDCLGCERIDMKPSQYIEHLLQEIKSAMEKGKE